MTTGLRGKGALVGLGLFIVTLLGIPARATYGAQTSADEPQYLLTALSIAQDGDLDITNQRYSGAYVTSTRCCCLSRPSSSRTDHGSAPTTRSPLSTWPFRCE